METTPQFSSARKENLATPLNIPGGGVRTAKQMFHV